MMRAASTVDFPNNVEYVPGSEGDLVCKTSAFVPIAIIALELG